MAHNLQIKIRNAHYKKTILRFMIFIFKKMVSFSRAATEKKNNLALIKSEILTAEEVEEEKRGEEVEIIPEAAQISVDSLIDMKEEKVREEE